MGRNRVRSSRLGGSLGAASAMGAGRLADEDRGEPGSLDNLMDVMLVFACGLLIALVANWNVDLGSVAGASSRSDMEPIEGEIDGTDAQSASAVEGFTDLGRVYRDDETGDLYIVTD